MFTSKVVSATTSKNNEVTKLLVQLQDGLQVETVVIRHGATTARRVHGEKRTTICVSSQVGCKMACSFCATGTMGELGAHKTGDGGGGGGRGGLIPAIKHAREFTCRFGFADCLLRLYPISGNLTSGEILEQLLHARKYSEISNVVFMGMGEPFNNYDTVVAAVRSLTDPKLFQLSPNRVTVSTVGIVPRYVLPRPLWT